MPPGHKLVLAFLGVFCTILVVLGLGLAVDMANSPSGSTGSPSDAAAEPDTAGRVREKLPPLSRRGRKLSLSCKCLFENCLQKQKQKKS